MTEPQNEQMDQEGIIGEVDEESSQVGNSSKFEDTPAGLDKFLKGIERHLLTFSCMSPERKLRKQSRDTAGSTKKCEFVTENGNSDNGNDDVYDFNHQQRGLAVIINNETFTELHNRPSDVDASDLKDTFEKLGFDVMPYNNLTAIKMYKMLEKASVKYDHENSDCFVCCILSHGDEVWNKRSNAKVDALYGVDDQLVAVKCLIDLFNCSTLQGKPRLFFIQACRGYKVDPGQDIVLVNPEDYREYDGAEYKGASGQTGESAQNEEADKDTAAVGMSRGKKPEAMWKRGNLDNPDMVPHLQTQLEQDYLVMYATPPGYYAWERESGSWFIQSLCQQLNSYANSGVSLMSILTKVNEQVANSYTSNCSKNQDWHNKKQISVIESKLLKDIYFTKSE